MKYYKLTMRWGGEKKDISVDYFDDLEKMCDAIWHWGCDGLPCFEKAEEISKEEYERNYLPV